LGKLAIIQYLIEALLTNKCRLLWVYVIFNIVGALTFYYLIRMPKPKKQNKKEANTTTGAATAPTADEPSRAGSSHNSETSHQGEKNGETARYASITGANTPPQQPNEISEKA